jgi:hypothetical protein
MRSRLRDRERDGDGRRTALFPRRCLLLLREWVSRLRCPATSLWRGDSCDISMRCDTERERVLRLPRSPGLKELMRRRVLRSPASGDAESAEGDRLRRLVRALSSLCFRRRGGERDREGERLVEMVDTESAEDERDRERLLRPDRSASFFLRISSATPFLRSRSSGTSVVSLGLSFGLSSCCVRDGRDWYGRSCAVALHS